MPISGRLIADFGSFYAAVLTAEKSLQSFERNAGKVETALNRMVEDFSGKKVIQDAVLMSEAIDRVGGVSKLTGNELQAVGAKAAEAVDKMKRLGMDIPPGIQQIADAAKSAEAPIKQMGEAAKSTRSVFGDFVGDIGKMAAGFLTAQAVMGGVKAAFSALSGLIGDSIKSFTDAEAAQRKMTAALTSASLATPEIINQFNALATEFQHTTVYSDDLINKMEALLVQVGGVMPSQMRNALKASTDLASGLGIDLESATMLVAKAASGHTETLGRYGITVSDAALRTQGFGAVLEAVNRQFGGQAAAQLETYTGKLQQAANAWDNVKEAIGKFILTDPLVDATLKRFADTAKSADEKASGLTSTLGDLAEVLARGIPGSFGDTLAVLIRNLEATARVQKIWNDIVEKGHKGYQQFIDDNKLADESQRILAAGIAESARLSKADEEAKKRQAEAIKHARAEAAAAAKKLAEENERVFASLKNTESAIGFNVRGLSDLGRMGGEVKIHIETFNEEIERLQRGGQFSAAALIQLRNAIATLPNVAPQGAGALKQVREETDKLGRSFADFLTHDLGRDILRAIQGGGDVLKTIGGSIGGFLAGPTSEIGQSLAKGIVSVFGKTFGGAINSVLPGVGTLLGAGLGKLFGKLFDNPEKAINPIREAFVQAAGGLDQLNRRAQVAGVTLAKLLDAKNPKQYQKAIEDLNAAFEFQDQAMAFLNATVEKYGFSISQLGPTLAGQKLGEQAALIQKEWYALNAAGIDINNVSIQMADNISKWFQNAMAAGTQIPASMREILHQLAAVGLLTDESGNKYDLAKIDALDYAKTTEGAMAGLQAAIEKLTEAITRGLGGALASLPKTIDIGVNYHNQEFPNLPDIVPMASGGMGRVSKPTLFFSRGNEDFAFSGEGKSFGGGGSQELAAIRRLLAEQPATMARAVRNELQKIVRAA